MVLDWLLHKVIITTCFATVLYVISLMSSRYQTSYKKLRYTTTITTEEPRCCKSMYLTVRYIHVYLHTSNYFCTISYQPYLCVSAVDGGWSDWQASECSKSCGGGIQILKRACDSPRPFCRGKQCIGPVTIARHCNTHPCPGT